MATRDERGWFGPADTYPGPEGLGRLRETELRAAAGVLGLQRASQPGGHVPPLPVT